MPRTNSTKISNPTSWQGLPAKGPAASDFGLSPLADHVDSLALRKTRRSRITHGIGGGMRLLDDVTEPMSRGGTFSRDWMDRRISLTFWRGALALYAAALLTVLCLIHVNIRFRIHDLLIQQRLIQTTHRELNHELATLDQRNAYLKDPERLRAYAASRLNMEPIQPELATSVVVSDALEQRYAPTDAVAEQSRRTLSQMARAVVSGGQDGMMSRIVGIGRTIAMKVSGK